MNLRGSNIVVYDCEIENVIDGKEITWNDHGKMGLSVAALYDYATDDYSVFLKGDVAALADRLNSADLVVAFNQKGFDNKLLAALGFPLRDDNHFDMLEKSRESIGFKGGGRFPTGLKLDDHLEATFGKAQMKTGHGEMAPIWWQEGLQTRVINYCLADVRRERLLFEHIVYKGWAKTNTHGPRFFDLDPVREAVRKALQP